MTRNLARLAIVFDCDRLREAATEKQREIDKDSDTMLATHNTETAQTKKPSPETVKKKKEELMSLKVKKNMILK